MKSKLTFLVTFVVFFILHASCFILSSHAQNLIARPEGARDQLIARPEAARDQLIARPEAARDQRSPQFLGTKLPFSINTPDLSELLPVISADGKTLYFTRTRTGMDSTIVFDIWRSRITKDSVFSKPEFVGGNLASSYGIAVTSISPDNNTLYLIGKMESDAPPDERLFVSHKLLDGWSIPEPIKIPNLHPSGIYTDYTFGPDQHTLVMALDRDSSLGDRDLFVSFFQNPRLSKAGAGGGSWSTPLWLGADINSSYAEMTPYPVSDNK